MSLNPIADIIQGVGQIAGDLITTDKERGELALKGRELDLKEKALDQQGDAQQGAINTEEAKSASTFTSGWRPFVGWTCGLGLAYVNLIEPVLRFVATVIFHYQGAFPAIDTTITMQVLIGMLGLSGLRSYDKKNGTAK